MKLIKISKKGNIKNIDKSDITFLKSNKNISKLNKWSYQGYNIELYGCENGDHGEENKYDLPPPCDIELYFNDLYFVKVDSSKKICDFLIEDYNLFYIHCFDGFESIENTDNEEEETLSVHTSDEEFINDGDISICSETNDISELSTFTSSSTNKNDGHTDTHTDTYTDTHTDTFGNLINSITITNDISEDNESVSSIEITISSASDNDGDIDTE